MKVGISWTGYERTWPNLPESVSLLIPVCQVISTTLTGNDRSVEFVSSSKCFDSFTIIPDSSLNGGLKPDENYINKFSNCLEQMYANNQMRKVRIITFVTIIFERGPFIKDALTNKGLQKNDKSSEILFIHMLGLDSENYQIRAFK